MKKSDDEKDLQKDAERAMQQILDKDYAHGLEGKTLLYGISFHSKRPYIVSRTWSSSIRSTERRLRSLIA